MKKYYKIAKHNSTVCGYPGRDFDWAKFDWDSKTSYDFGDARYTSGGRMGIVKAPEVYPDDFFIGKGNQYLHIPYTWNEQATVYRVRPNESMRAGKIYRGKLVKKQTIVRRKGIWYWVVESDIEL